MTGAVATHLQNRGRSKPFHTAMLIPMMAFICAWVYPIYVNLYNKETLDLRRITTLDIVAPSEKELALQESHVAEPNAAEPQAEDKAVSMAEQKEVV